MARRGRCFPAKSLKLHEILSALECEDDNETSAHFVYVEPPMEQSGQATDEDSDKSDEEHEGNLNHLGRLLLQSTGELQRSQPRSHDVMPCTSTGIPSYNAGNSQESSDESDDDDDNQPLASLRTRISSSKIVQAKKKRTTLWKKTLPNFTCSDLITQPTLEESRNCKDPLDYFKLFIHKELDVI